ncbi:MAG TPA: SDR family oxidoreductase [Caulobacteraceae bacterium]|jgi:NAD(P)-dependent dehydrogenase (short-subunit alcohol dehydrogenase family)
MTPDDMMFKPGAMTGQRVLVTGGGTGLGKVMAEGLVMLGAEVYICGRRGGVLEAAAREITDAHGGSCTPVACDIRVPEAIHEMMDKVWAGGPLTGLINNAAGNFISRTEDLSPRGFDAISNIVFRGSFFVTQEAGKRWIAEKKKGAVVSILTTWIWHGGPFTVPSAMSKAGLNVMTQSLAVEWAPKGIRFNAIAPGPFPTEGAWARLNPGNSRQVESDDESSPGNPMGRVGRMPELANLAVYLLHPGSEYVNGQTIAIDGGAWLAGGGGFSTLRNWSDEQWAQARASIQGANEKDRAQRTV